ncbi:P-protein [gamma proteobacterium HTCC5015]|nr:P-protein [gamma proteobacterium HTCC5015]
MSDSKALQTVRDEIDALDREIQRLVNRRAECAMQVAEIKREVEASDQFYRPEREAQVLRSVVERNEGPLAGETVARLFREIMSACLALEEPMTVAYLGPEGTFTQAAALKHFGHGVTTAPLSAIDDIFRDVESGAVHYGVVPVENSTEGVVTHTLDTFINSPLKISGEVALRIHHNLLNQSGDLGAVQKICAHQQALAQCREWLDEHMPNVVCEPLSSNAEAAKLAAADSSVAAIASDVAAELYELRAAASNIEDEPDNTTRFLVIGRQDIPASGNDKTSIMVSMRNEPGALAKLLQPLAEQGVDMTRIESRPSRRGNWEYVFFLDLLGHQEDRAVQNALAVIKKEAAVLKILGSYPRAVL